MTRDVTPFGLREATPISLPAAMASSGRGARAERHGFDGRPLSEQSDGDDPPSNPTELDGKDPINVDSDPFYD